MRPETMSSSLFLLVLFVTILAVSDALPHRERQLQSHPNDLMGISQAEKEEDLMMSPSSKNSVQRSELLYDEDDEDGYPTRAGFWNNSNAVWNNSYTFMTKVSNWVSTYTSQTVYALFTYPWYNPSGGVIAAIVFFTILYAWILISGWTVTNGRSFLGSILDERDIDQLTQRILTAIDRLPHTFASRSGDLKSDGETEDGKPPVDRSGLNFGVSSSGPTWSTSVSQAPSWSGYISTNLYNWLIWLGKPYAGMIASLGGLALFMVIHVIIIMTQGVFPTTQVGSGRKGWLEDEEAKRLTHSILEAIDHWAQRIQREPRRPKMD